MAQDMGLITDTWMTQPWMFDPTQLSNAYSNYNNAALPWPPSYNTGAGGPVNAATGQPIQSFQNWQQQNPAGMNINATPTQPQAPAAPSNPFAGVQVPQGMNTAAYQPRGGLSIAQWQALTPQQRIAASGPLGEVAAGVAATPSDSFVASHNNPSGGAPGAGSMFQGLGAAAFNQMASQGAPQAGPQGGAGAPPNNWQQAINSLANPGKPITQGANVPLVQGYQPSGGINQSFLQQAQGRPGMNANFLSALAALQNRPQQ
jgi:hypothetical protein